MNQNIKKFHQEITGQKKKKSTNKNPEEKKKKEKESISTQLISKINRNNFIKQSNKILQQKYFCQFYFYYSNTINEILINKLKSHVINFKDYLFYDDDSEFFKRFYQANEQSHKFSLINTFYQHNYHPVYPNLFIT